MQIIKALIFSAVATLASAQLRGADVVTATYGALKATCVLGGGTATGVVTFSQASATGPVTISGTINGLVAGNHGLHIHQSGDLSTGCAGAGPHFNPFNKNHGAQTDAIRHVGDLGNIVTDAAGATSFSYTDKVISLQGYLSIVGRAVVVHAGADDLGRGVGDLAAGSVLNGNAGARAGCCVIGLANASA